MRLSDFAVVLVDWRTVDPFEYRALRGSALIRTQVFGSDAEPLRVRMIDCAAGFATDWLEKGRVLLLIDGDLEIEIADGRRFALTPGCSLQVADNTEPYRSSTRTGARVFTVE